MSRVCFSLQIALSLAILATPSLNAATVRGSGSITVTVTPSGTYTVSAPEYSWEFTGALAVPATNLVVGTGADGAGSYQEIAFDFQTDAARHAAIRAYTDRSAILFSVSNPQSAAPNTFAFPNWSKFPQGMDHVSFNGSFAPPVFSWMSPEGPWAFYDSSYRTFILSAAANFMTASTVSGPQGEIASGIDSRITSLPQGFEHRTLLVLDNGINRAFDSWGNTLTALQSKSRPANDADTSLNQIGYWTDNGATYYYQMAPSMSYQQTLAAVKNGFDQLGIKLGYVQLDSWFYPKGPGAGWSDNGSGIYQYTAAPSLFTSGLGSFQRTLNIPLITHARWIDSSSPYRKSYKMSGNVILDPAYWDTVAGYLANNGVATYEQDWLSDKAQTDFNLTDADTFLDNMAAAMERRKVTMQYCMATPRHFLQTSKYSHLTTIRTSADRLSRARWTDFVYTSRLASALGVWPFTDNFLSTETTHVLLATLSAGPIGVGDAVGALSGTNLLHAVRKDGVIVKPDVPLTPSDASFAAMSHSIDTPQIATTYSDFHGVRTTYLFAFTQASNTQVAVRPADYGLTGQVAVYDYTAGAVQVIDAAATVSKAITGDALYLVLAPVGTSGMALIGDTGQFVTTGKKRIPALTDDGAVHVSVTFAAGEDTRTITGYSPVMPAAHASAGTVHRLAYDAATGLFRIQVTPGDGGTASFTIRPAANRTPPGRGRAQ